MNIQFEYLYRDAGNFKNWGNVIFTNKDNCDLYYLEQELRNVLIDGEFFNADIVGIPNLRFQSHITKLDHEWNEFYALSQVMNTEHQNDTHGRDIYEFMVELRNSVTI